MPAYKMPLVYFLNIDRVNIKHEEASTLPLYH